MKILRRLTAAMLVLVMVVTMLPVGALADETEPTITETTAETEPVDVGEVVLDVPETAETELVETAPETTAPEFFVEKTAEAIAADAPTSGTCGENVTWTLVDGVLTIGGEGDMPDFLTADTGNPPWYTFENEIIAVIVEEGITSIGRAAFEWLFSLEDISLPESLVSIGDFAFGDCGNVKEIIIPENVKKIGDFAFTRMGSLQGIHVEPDNTAYLSSGGVLFNKDMTTLVAYPGGKSGSYTIPDSVTEVAIWAMSECEGLTEVHVPASVTTLNQQPFVASANLKKITVSSQNPSYIAQDGVLFDKSMTQLIVYPTQREGDYSVPEGVESLGAMAFTGAEALTNIYIPASVTDLTEDRFHMCTGLENITVSPDNTVYASQDGVLFDKSLSTLLTCPDGRQGSYTIPQGTTTIEDAAFSWCENLTDIFVPESVADIGNRAFDYCEKLKDVYYAGSEADWNTLMTHTGWGNDALLSAAIHYNTTVPDETIPEETEPDSDVVLSGTCGKNAVWSFDPATGTLTISGEGEMADYDSWGNGQPWGNVRTDITNVVIENGITSVGMQAFHNLWNLTDLEIAGSVTTIYERGFSWCESLKEIVIPDSVTYIGKYAFEGCTSLESLTIPVSVTSISYKAISICDNLKDIYYGGTQEQWEALTSVYQNNIPETTIIHYNSTGPDDSETEIRVSYGAKTEITGGTKGSKALNRLQDYLDDWEKAYNKWVKAVKKGMKKFSATDEEEEESAVRQQADILRKHDEKEGKKDGKYLTGNLTGYENEAYHALASFLYYEGIQTSIPEISSLNPASPTFAMQLINIIKNNIAVTSKTYTYANATVYISANSYAGVDFGKMTITPRDGSTPRSATIFSDMKQLNAAMQDYVSELKDLSISATYNVASEFYKDILGISLSELTSQYVNSAVGNLEKKLAIKLSEKLGQAGVGENLIKTLDECYTFFTWVEKLIDLGSEGDPSGTLEKIRSLKFEDTTVFHEATQTAMEALQMANTKMKQALQAYMDGTLVKEKKGFWRWLFGCPVSICVYNSAGEQIGYVGEDDIWYTDDISITELGGIKELVSFTEDALSFTITATDHGTMSCMFEQYDENFYPVGRLNYYNIILEPEQTFQVSVPETLAEKTETAVITSGGEAIYPDEYISSEDSAGVTISCSAVTEDGITGGAVSGTGTYIRGDCVILRAEAYEGFRFVGWMDGEYLVGTEEIYEFPAREDCQLAARFYKEKPIAIQLEADIGGTAIGESRYDSGETVTIIAIPASGYSFAGWYAGETLLSADAEYSFPASESLTLRAAFAQSEHPYDLGDVNHDTKINAKDATLILQKSVGVLKETAAFCETCAEVSGDGKLNAKDSTLILQFSVGLRDSFPAGA